MANKPLDTKIFDDALIFAINAHKNTERRGHKTPYSIHICEACAIAESITNDQEILAACALHDVVEDTSVSIEEIEEKFGKRVAHLVDEETVVLSGLENDTWKQRKEIAINKIRNASKDAKIVALADKLSNMRAIYRDYTVYQNEIWKKFHETNPSLHKWHYEGLLDALKELNDTFAYKELKKLYELVFNGIE